MTLRRASTAAVGVNVPAVVLLAGPLVGAAATLYGAGANA